MKRLVLALTITVAFLVGCLTATVAAKFVIPIAKAGTKFQKWDYKCVFAENSGITMTASEESEAALKTQGKQGWELVTVSKLSSGLTYCFKRPLP